MAACRDRLAAARNGALDDVEGAARLHEALMRLRDRLQQVSPRPEVNEAMKDPAIVVQDLLAMRCIVSVGHTSREAFLQRLERAFSQPLGDLQSQLLNSYRQNVWGLEGAFSSNTHARGRRRPRHARVGGGDAAAATSAEATDADGSSAGRSVSSSGSAALAAVGASDGAAWLRGGGDSPVSISIGVGGFAPGGMADAAQPRRVIPGGATPGSGIWRPGVWEPSRSGLAEVPRPRSARDAPQRVALIGVDMEALEQRRRRIADAWARWKQLRIPPRYIANAYYMLVNGLLHSIVSQDEPNLTPAQMFDSLRNALVDAMRLNGDLCQEFVRPAMEVLGAILASAASPPDPAMAAPCLRTMLEVGFAGGCEHLADALQFVEESLHRPLEAWRSVEPEGCSDGAAYLRGFRRELRQLGLDSGDADGSACALDLAVRAEQPGAADLAEAVSAWAGRGAVAGAPPPDRQVVARRFLTAYVLFGAERGVLSVLRRGVTMERFVEAAFDAIAAASELDELSAHTAADIVDFSLARGSYAGAARRPFSPRCLAAGLRCVAVILRGARPWPDDVRDRALEAALRVADDCDSVGGRARPAPDGADKASVLHDALRALRGLLGGRADLGRWEADIRRVVDRARAELQAPPGLADDAAAPIAQKAGGGRREAGVLALRHLWAQADARQGALQEAQLLAEEHFLQQGRRQSGPV